MAVYEWQQKSDADVLIDLQETIGVSIVTGYSSTVVPTVTTSRNLVKTEIDFLLRYIRNSDNFKGVKTA